MSKLRGAQMKRAQGLVQLSMASLVAVAAVVLPGGFDYKIQKKKQNNEEKYWAGVERKLMVARAKDEEYTALGLVDPNPPKEELNTQDAAVCDQCAKN